MVNRLNEIRERLNNTTKGKWITKNLLYDGSYDPYIVNEDGVYICQTVYDNQSYTEEHNVDEDTIFIANAKDDIQFLLDYIDNIETK